MARSKVIGLIAEDESDVQSLKEIIRLVVGNDTMGFKKFIGRGCGKMRRKCFDWAKQLKSKGCDVLIIVHDLDSKDHNELHLQIKNSISPFVIEKSYICIPIQEMEAWFLADTNAIKRALNMRSMPRVKYNPETINSPKEYLRDLVKRGSKDEKIYLNTVHNPKIAQNLDLHAVKNKCKSFQMLHDFIKQAV